MTIPASRVWRYNERRKKYLGEMGKIVSYSIVRIAPTGLMERTPYIVAVIEIGSEFVVGQVVDYDLDSIKTGMKVVGVLRRLFNVSSDGVLLYGVKFSLNI